MKQQKVVALTLGSRGAASSRIRAHIPLDHLESGGLSVTRVIASSKFWPLRLFFSILLIRPDVVFVQKVMPPRWFLVLSRRMCSRMVFDLDDAIYLGYPGASPREVKKIDSRVRGGLVFFDRVLTSNELIREDLGLAMDPRCIVYPGPSPDAAFTGVQGDLKEKVVLWLGSPSTISNVESILPGVVEQLPDVRILIVGSPNDGPQLGSIRRQRWTTEVESKALRCSWSGLMPLQVSAWNQRKAGYKILEYLSYGVVPVVQDSPIVRTLLGRRTSELCELVSGDTPQDWAAAIQRSLDRTTDQTWIEGRDAVFETWSSVGFSRLIISAKSSGGSFE